MNRMNVMWADMMNEMNEFIQCKNECILKTATPTVATYIINKAC